MEDEIILLNEINKNIMVLYEEVKESKNELENLRAVIKQQKCDYNKEIKEYQTLTTSVLEEEKSLEEIEKSRTKVRYKQKVTLHAINNDFVKHFNEFSSRLQPEVINALLEFFGYNKTPFNIFKKLIKDDEEFKCILEFSEILNTKKEIFNKSSQCISNSLSVGDFKTKNEILDMESMHSNIVQTKEKILNIKNKYVNCLQYPIDRIFEFVTSVYFLSEKEEEKKLVLEKIKNLQIKKNFVFLGLKGLESEIVKNDSQIRTITKYIKSINTLFERFTVIKDSKDEHRLENLKEFSQSIKDFKKLDFSNSRKFDNMNNLTLKSEYSEEHSDLVSNFEENNMNNILSNINLTINENEGKQPNHKLSQDNLIKVENNKKQAETDKMNNNMKKINNKQLKITNKDSELDVTDLKKKKMRSFTGKIKSKEKIAVKGKNGANGKNLTILSPRIEKKTISNKSDNSSVLNSFQINNIQHSQSKQNIKTDSVEKVKSNDIFQAKRKPSQDFVTPSKNSQLTPKIENAKIEMLQTNNILESPFSPTTSTISRLALPPNMEHLESVSDEWMISPLNKIPIQTSKLISEKPVRAKSVNKSLPNYLNLKIDKPISNSTGCCVSCV